MSTRQDAPPAVRALVDIHLVAQLVQLLAPHGAESCIPGVLAIFTPYLDRPAPPVAPDVATAAGDVGRLSDAEHLSDAEFTVLRLIATDLTVPEIGHELGLSRNTVKSRVARIHHKLGTRTSAQAVARGVVLGMLDLDNTAT